MKRNRPEDAIQRAVFEHIRARPALNLVAFAVPNGGARSKAEAAIMQGLGVTAGVPDIILIHDGRVYALELKAEKGKLTEAQTEMMWRLCNAGAKVGVTYGLDGALDFLESYGLLRGEVQ